VTLLQLDTSQAACRAADPTIFLNKNFTDQAKRICAACPIQQACREATLQTEKCWGPKARDGVFGGLTAAERYAIDRERWPELRARKSTNLVQRRAAS
jgi:hypothetical protein